MSEMEWSGHVACLREMKNAYKILVRKHGGGEESACGIRPSREDSVDGTSARTTTFLKSLGAAIPVVTLCANTHNVYIIPVGI